MCQLFEDFESYLANEVLDRATSAFDQLYRSDDEDLRRLLDSAVGKHPAGSQFSLSEIFNLVEGSVQLRPEMKRANDRIKQEIHRIANRLLYVHKSLIDELVEALPSITQDLREEEDDDEELEDTPLLQSGELRNKEEKQLLAAEVLKATLRSLSRANALGRSSVGGRARRVIKFLGDRIPPRESLSEVGLRIVRRGHLRSLINSPRLFVMGAPRYYNRFRREAFKEGRLFNLESADAIRQMRISKAELDVLILTMLRNSRRLFSEMPSQLTDISSQDWLENIKSQYLMQVFVDEATDFSAIQLACTMELSHPQLRSWFACGDLNQRITSYGIEDLTEIEWLKRVGGDVIEMSEVDIAYRQSRRLRELANALRRPGDSGSRLSAPEQGEEADVWPLLAENQIGEYLGSWLAQRIVEVERAVGRLPSIAVFVDGDLRIDPLVELIRPLLAGHNIPVVGCKDGRVVGDNLEVRVFDIRHIKGLEFEAVFFLGIDSLAERTPELFERFFYVGASRAAMYLGITCEGQLPSKLEHVRAHFRTNGW
jgi:hypothetical protein